MRTRARLPRRRAATIAIVVTALVGALVGTTGSPAPAGAVDVPAAPGPWPVEQPLRVLVVGDSVSQGSAGDWTWRYRLGRHLAVDGAPVDFVGPRSDLYDNVTDTQGSTAYADPGFDRDHAARWGLTLALMELDWSIADLVREHRPDVVVEMLGVNDLTFLGQSAEEVADDLRGFVADARSADADVDVVLGHLTQTWYEKVPELNDRIDALADDLDTAASRVAVATTDAGFEREVHTWDEAHPNARGEVLVAAAFADALAGLGHAAPYPRPLAFPAAGPGLAVPVTASAGNGTARLSWTRVPGATADEAQVRDITAHAPWEVLPPTTASTARELRGLINGHLYAVRVRSTKGWAVGDWSAEVRFRPLPPLPAAVRLRVVRSPQRDMVRVVGVQVAGAATYRLQLARPSPPARPATRQARATPPVVPTSGARTSPHEREPPPSGCGGWRGTSQVVDRRVRRGASACGRRRNLTHAGDN